MVCRLDCWRCWADLRETREELPPDSPVADEEESDADEEHAGRLMQKEEGNGAENRN